MEMCGCGGMLGSGLKLKFLTGNMFTSNYKFTSNQQQLVQSENAMKEGKCFILINKKLVFDTITFNFTVTISSLF